MRPACFGSVALLKKLGESLYAVHVFDVVVRSLFDETYSGHGGANVRTEDMLAAPWGAESADFAGVEAKQWLVVCFCKLASTVGAGAVLLESMTSPTKCHRPPCPRRP